ncbi:hypothetical protein CLV63_103392 [Murinocardiopsis flavida]|uniref:Uncharacterized protein n=1 Tax=Murinocardiopsis flavida TaxID=645275 RepID=A0A2P8DR27_9ACTN|nr:hypothetical protein [Murinocardiopsis flavida]PSK99665.1 hypothetical protein CLV63_103392 [Murinocardiopsis flavida]
MFCGDELTPGYTACTQQMTLFAVASLIPAMLALILLVAAFAAPGLRGRPELRTQALLYSMVAWALAGFTYVLGALPSF